MASMGTSATSMAKACAKERTAQRKPLRATGHLASKRQWMRSKAAVLVQAAKESLLSSGMPSHRPWRNLDCP